MGPSAKFSSERHRVFILKAEHTLNKIVTGRSEKFIFFQGLNIPSKCPVTT
jgi:hypothetical protein